MSTVTRASAEINGQEVLRRVYLFQPRNFKWGQKKIMAKNLARRFLAAPESMADIRRIGNTMAKCSDFIGLQWCPECGSYHVSRAYLCKSRLCPICSWRRSATRAAEMMKVADELARQRPDLKAAMLTLTVRSCALSELRATIKGMLRGWSLLMHRPRIRRWVIGAARNVEITRNPETGLYHPHIHALLIFNEDYSFASPQLTAHDWVSVWQECLGIDYAPVCDIRAAYSVESDGQRVYSNLAAAIAETSKYITKPSIVDDMTDAELWAYSRALVQIKFYSYHGIFNELRHALKVREDDIDPQPVMSCPNCASSGLISATLYWSTRDNAYMASAVDGVLEDTLREWAEAAAESRKAALRGDTLMLKRELTAAIGKK